MTSATRTFAKMSRGTRLQDKNTNSVFVPQGTGVAFTAGQKQDFSICRAGNEKEPCCRTKTRIQLFASRGTKTIPIILTDVALHAHTHLLTPSRGDRTRAACLTARMSRYPVDDDNKKCPGGNEVRK